MVRRVSDPIVIPLPFNPPSEELFKLIASLGEMREDLMQVGFSEWGREELLALSELTPLQIDRLLTRGRL